MDFRSRLLATLEAVAPVLEEPGVLVIGSEVPNLLQPGAVSTLVVSEDVDIGVPVTVHDRVKLRLRQVRDLHPSPEEPSVWLPNRPDLIEVNFFGMDPTLKDPGAAYVFEDSELPLMVFGALSYLRPGRILDIETQKIPLPRPAGLLLEKLVSDRTGIKGSRDALVALGLLLETRAEDLGELGEQYRGASAETRHTVRSNLTILSLLDPTPGMPDPRPHREVVRTILRRLEILEERSP